MVLVWIGLASGTTLLQSKVMMFSCVIKKRERRPHRATGAVVQALTEKPVCLRIDDVEKAVTSLGTRCIRRGERYADGLSLAHVRFGVDSGLTA